MQRRFQKANRNQILLLPPSIDDWVAEEHLARFIWDCVETFDLKPFYQAYANEGAPPYDPQMMLATLLYAWATGTRSSRKIAKACEDQVPYRWLTGNIMPDHCAFARFRTRHESDIRGLFTQVLTLCQETGLIRLGRVFLDGTKIQGNSALSSSHTKEYFDKEIARLVEESKAADDTDDKKYGNDKRGDELPAKMKSTSGRLERLRQAQERLERKAAEERVAQEKVLADRADEEQRTGKKKGGRKPVSPNDAVNHDRKANATEPESRIMKGNKGFVQGYNGQAVVTDGQIIIAAEVTQDENDIHQLVPMLTAVTESLEDAGIEQTPKALAADAGYWHDGLDIQRIENEGPELFIATANRHKERKSVEQEPAPRGRIPKDASKLERMTRKLRTERGKAVYRQRCQTVEPVFGQIKSAMGFDRFLRRGLKAVQSEWLLICACCNLLKLHRFAFS